MPIELPTTKKQRLFILVLVVVILITVVVIWWAIAPFSPAEVSPVSVRISEERLIKKIPTELDLSIFDHPWFEKAKIHAKLPVEAGVTGRDNPFKPY